MPQANVAQLELRGSPADGITAWVDGRYLGVVHTDGDGVYVRINRQSVGSIRSASAVSGSKDGE